MVGLEAHASEIARTLCVSQVAETPENCPTSTDTATEQHVRAEWDEDDLSTTKALTQGMKSVDNGIVRCQDPRTSLEASAQGTSTKCIETTAVVLESMLHEMQNQSQYSLPLTPRPPIEGEPSGCKQEVVDSIMMAECTNGTVKLAKPNKSDVDVNGKATLGSEPATVACGVDEGAETEHDGESQLQQTYFYCEKDRQRNGNATENIPIAYGLLLEGEWTVYPSGEASDSRSNAKAFNAAIEHADGLGESTETANTKEVESEGCSRGMDKQACVDKVGGNAGRGTRPADTLNELTEFVTLSIESEDLGGGDIPRVRLGAMQMRTGDVNGSRGQTDWSDDQTDEPRGQTYVPNQSNNAEMASISHGDGAGTYLGAGDAKCGVEVTNGVGSQTDMSIGRGDVPSVETDPNKPAKAPEDVSITRKKDKPPNLPMEATRQHSNESNACGDQTDMLITCTDTHTIGDETKTAENETEIVSTQRNSLKTRDLPYTPENETPKSIRQQRRVSAGNGDIHILWNVPIGVLG